MSAFSVGMLARSMKSGIRAGVYGANIVSRRTFASASTPNVTLYQYEVCPYCCGLKGVMDFYDIKYKSVEVNPLTKKEYKVSEEITDKKYRKVPVAVVDGVQINDSRKIIEKFRELEVVPATTPEIEADLDWAYTKLSILFPSNIYRTWPEAKEAFDYVAAHKEWSAVTRGLVYSTGSVMMHLLVPKMMKKHNITDARASIYAALDDWMGRVETNGLFRGGDKPNQADLVVYGMLTAMRDMQTLRDCRARDAKFDAWYSRVQQAVGPSKRI